MSASSPPPGGPEPAASSARHSTLPQETEAALATPTTSSRRRLLLGALALGAAGATGAALWKHRRRRRTLRLACGVHGGTFLPLGRVLAQSFESRIAGLHVEALETPGGATNVTLLEQNRADLALVSNHVRGGASIALVAPLGEETVQIVARRAAGLRTPHDLRGHTISPGAAGSGTERLTHQILEHFGVARGSLTLRNLAPEESRDALLRGEIDAAFIVAAMRTPVVDALLARGDMELLSLGDPSRVGSALEGIRIDAPYLRPTVIPERTYGELPVEPVGTVASAALLVARRSLDEELVQDLAAALFADKVRLAQHNAQLARLTERFDPGDAPYPLHPGADRYYRRDDPSFLAKNADQVSLWITLGALGWSGLTALRVRSRRRQHTRVEVFHEQVRALTVDARAADTVPKLRAVRGKIEALRDRAFDELVQDRMEPNEGFRILQQRLDALLAELDHAESVGRVLRDHDDGE